MKQIIYTLLEGISVNNCSAAATVDFKELNKHFVTSANGFKAQLWETWSLPESGFWLEEASHKLASFATMLRCLTFIYMPSLHRL